METHGTVKAMCDRHGWVELETHQVRQALWGQTHLYDTTDWFCVVRICNSPMGSEKAKKKKKKFPSIFLNKTS